MRVGDLLELGGGVWIFFSTCSSWLHLLFVDFFFMLFTLLLGYLYPLRSRGSSFPLLSDLHCMSSFRTSNECLAKSKHT